MDDIRRIVAEEAVRTVFQPFVELDSGRIVGYEALSRGPEGPLERPDDLFAAAREADLLAPLDELCRRTALRSGVRAGVVAPLTLFVNVEPEVLDRAPLDELLDLADQTPGSVQVVLEITERSLAKRPAELLSTVRRLRSAGWRIALDDVGANDVSLAFMSVLRPEVVKLDLRLIQDRPDLAIAEIMNAVNSYAERSGAVVVAEGIEDEGHLAQARAMGAHLGQGWLFGRPSEALDTTRPIGGLRLPTVPPALRSTTASPFACLPDGVALRRSTKPLLVAVSKHLEQEARRFGRTGMVVSSFQERAHFGGPTSERYARLAAETSFVAVLGEGLGDEPAPGVRGATIRPGDAMRGEWNVAVLTPHFSAALLARELTHQEAPSADRDREFAFALTYDRDTVAAAAEAMLARLAEPDAPLTDGPGGGPAREELSGILPGVHVRDQVEVGLLQANVSGTRLGVLTVEIDGVAEVNASAGFDAGNAILREVGSRLRRRLRRGDAVVRIDGSTFVVLLTALGRVTAGVDGRRVARSLEASLAEPYVGAAPVVGRVTAYTAPVDCLDADEVLRLAGLPLQTS